MKPLVGGFILLCATGASAAPLVPVTGQSLNGIPLAQALSTMKELDSHNGPRLLEMMSKPGGECGVSDMDDADTCSRYTLFAMEWGETTQPVDFALFQLPETLGWSVPKDAPVVRWQDDKETMLLNACEMKKTAKGWSWQGTFYRLTISEKMTGHWSFTADLTKLPRVQPDCGEYAASTKP